MDIQNFVQGSFITILRCPEVYFTNILRIAFTRTEPKSVKNTVKSSIFFCTFGICTSKSSVKNAGEIDPWNQETILVQIFFFYFAQLLLSYFVIHVLFTIAPRAVSTSF